MKKQSYRPVYHASVPAGWANDPNGTIFYGGKAHLFYQHYPYKPEWGTMHWGHFVTEDFVRWENLPVALAHVYGSAAGAPAAVRRSLAGRGSLF